jgi:long-chain acyl-CoA synthetase
VLNSGLGAGATLHRQFDPDVVQRSIKDNDITMFFGVPTTFIAMYERLSVDDVKKIRYYFSAAAPLSVEVARKWQDKFGAFIYQGYGLTETSPFATYNHLTIVFQKNILEIQKIQWVIILQLESKISQLPPYIKLTLYISIA